MDINDKKALAGQMMMVGFPGNFHISDEVKSFLEEYKIGNVILFGENIKDKTSLLHLCNEIQTIVKKATGYPALISLDQEGGMVNRFSPDIPSAPSAMAIGATGNPEYAYLSGRMTAEEMKMFGLNFNLAPSVDINNNKNNPVIGVRSYGEDADSVIKFAEKMVEGLASEGIIPCIKHFPGHGDTGTDSHLSLPTVAKTQEELRHSELRPFKALIDKGVEAVMTSHILFPTFDSEYPATMSRRILNDLLREELGFQGIIVTDCLEMGAVKENFGSVFAASKAVEAGVDLLCVSHDWKVARDILDMVTETFDTSRLLQSANKILNLKKKLAALPHPAINNEKLELIRDKFEKMRYDCINLINAPTPFPAITEQDTLFLGCPAYRSTLASGEPYPFHFAEYMGNKFKTSFLTIPLTPSEEDTEAILRYTENYRNIIVGSYNAHLLKEQGAFLKKLEAAVSEGGKTLTLVALRNPYDLELIGDSCFKIATYEYDPSTFDALSLYLERYKV